MKQMRPSNFWIPIVVAALGLVAIVKAEDSSGGLSPTRVKLPRGPGSLEGVGENAEAQLNQGQASYGVPFALPAGQQGLTPSLGLHYSSGGGSSVVGLGWTLGGVPTIERMTARGLPEFDATDIFASGSGAELVRVTGGSGTQRIYRERFEGSFTRYTWIDATGTGQAGHWKVETADGRVHYYGADADGATVAEARLLGRGGAVFGYYLVESVDPFGHRIHYDYVLDGGRPLLTTVSWGYDGFTSSATPRYTASLTYEPRPDVLTDGKPGVPVQLTQRVASVTIRVSGAQLRRYGLSYEPLSTSGGLSRLARVATYGTDDVTSNPIAFSFSYSRALGGSCMSGGGAQCVSPVRETVGSVGADFVTDDVDFVDMNGDGMPDVVHTPSNGAHRIFVQQRSATGDATFASMVTSAVSGSGGALLSNADVELVDLDGDGRTDLIDRVNNRVLRNGGSTGDWRAAELLDTHMPQFSTDANLRFLDVDYDRETDLVHLSPSGAWYTRNLGGGVYAQTPTPIPGLSLGFVENGIRLADMNGDGMPDAVQYTPSGDLWYFPNLGRGEFGSAVVMTGLPNGWNATNTELVDLSGDGLTDVVLVSGTEIRFALNQDAQSFTAMATITSSSVEGGSPGRPLGSSLRFVDMNANGTTDVVYVTAGGLVEYVELFRERPNLLVRVNNGIGKRIELAYDTVLEHMTRDGGSGAWARELPNPMVVLASITLTDTRTNVPQVQQMFYRNGYWDAGEHQFRGFEEVWVRTPGDAHVETGEVLHTFDVGVTDRYHRGLPLRVETRSNGRVLTVANSEWADCSVAQATAIGTLPVRFICSPRSTTDIVEGLSPAETVQTEDDYQYDGYGNRIATHKLGIVSRGGQACAACTRDTSSIQGEPCGAICVGDEQHEIVDFIAPGSATNGRWMLHVPYRKRTFGIEGSSEIAEERTYYDGPDFVGLPLGSVNRGAMSRVEQRRAAGVDAWRASQRLATDAHGNPTALMDGNGHRRTFAFDAAGLLIAHEQVEFDDPGHAPYALRMEMSYHPVLEQVVSSTSWMRVVGGDVVSSPRSTAYGYDSLGRITALAEPGDSLATPTQEFAYQLADPVSRIITRRRSVSGSSTADLEAVQCFDGLGRKYQERRRIETGRYQVSGTQIFDAQGQAYRQYQPYLASTDECDVGAGPGALLFTETKRDAAHRALEVVQPDATDYGGVASVERTMYRPLAVDGWDQEDNNASGRHANTPTTIVRDGLNRVVRTLRRLNTSDAPIAIGTTYESLGRIRSLVDDSGNEQHQRYDLLGRIVEVNHPDSGRTTYEYDDADNRLARTDARGVATRQSFDEANRVTSRVDAARAAETEIRFRYDGNCTSGPLACANGEGQLVETTHPLLEGEWARTRIGRDVRGREVAQIVERGTRTYEFAMQYDAADRLVGRTFPEGTTLTNTLDGLGRPVAIPGFVDEVAYDARGLASRTALANGVVTTRTFDGNQRLRSMTTTTPTSSERAQDLAYTWDRAGNLVEVDDARVMADAAPSESARYDYDGLYRLTSAALDLGRSREETLSFTYDRIDNLVGNASSLGATSAAHVGELRYGENGAGPRAVTTVGGDAYRYDVAGHVTERLGLRHEWDFLGRLGRSVRAESGELVSETAYGVEWDRAQQVGHGHASEYVAPDYEVRDGIATIYVILGDRPVARVERAAAATNEFADLAPASVGGATATSHPDGQIDVADAWLLEARKAGFLDVKSGAPTPSGPQANVEVALEAAAMRRLLGEDGTDTTFEHADHLGTTTSETDEAGTIVQRALAYPYGTPRYQEGTGWSRHGFTGMERDRGTGLQLHGARWLDARSGGWLTSDPLFESLAESLLNSRISDGVYQSAIAGFGYVNGSPTTNVDPTGFRGEPSPGQPGPEGHGEPSGRIPQSERVRPPPEELVTIDRYGNEIGEGYRGPRFQLTRPTLEAFRALRADGLAHGVSLVIGSSYRDDSDQARRFASAVERYGSVEEASRWVSPPGAGDTAGGSEHRTGRTIDFHVEVDRNAPRAERNRQQQAGQAFLAANAARFGFNNYPEEWWHWSYNVR